MKKYFVYELYTELGSVEYVGESANPTRRYYDHTYKTGRFYKRNDIRMRVVEMFDTRKEAWDYQCKLQSNYGLITDGEKLSIKQIGRKANDDTKQKQRLKKLGTKASDETKLKMSVSQKQRRLMEHMPSIT